MVSHSVILQTMNKGELGILLVPLQVAFMEKPNVSKGRHWYIAGAAVAALAIVGVVAKVQIPTKAVQEFVQRSDPVQGHLWIFTER